MPTAATATTSTNPQASAQASLTTLQLFSRAIRETGALYWPVLRHAWGWILVLHVVHSGATQAFSWATDFIRAQGREDLLLIVTVALLELLVNLLWSAAWVTAISVAAAWWLYRSLPANSALTPGATTPDSPPAPAQPGLEIAPELAEHFQQLIIEQIRALAAILWRVPLLIIPAAVEYVRLALVPYIVVLSRRYHDGQIDALSESRRLARGHFLPLLMAVLFSLVVPWGIEALIQGEGGSWIWVNPLRVTIGLFVTLFINLAFGIFLFSVYHHLSMIRSYADIRLDPDQESRPRTDV